MLEILNQPLENLGVTPLECTANVLSAVSVWLAARNNVHTWWVGIIGCVLFAILFYLNQLYADVTLQVFFIATSCLGWFQWTQGYRGKSLPVQRSTFQFTASRVILALFVAALYGTLLHTFTNAFAPYIDSLVLTFSVLAQLLMMQRRIENWPAWLIVNTISVPLYLSRGLYVTTFFYAIYWFNVIYGFAFWKKELVKA